MTTSTTVEATGRDLNEVIKCANKKLAAYYGDTVWKIVSVDARPIVESFGKPTPDVWIADVTGESTA